MDAHRRVYAPEHLRTLFATGGLADILVRENRYAEAEKILANLLETYRPKDLNGADPINNMGSLAVILSYEKQAAKAESLLQQAL